MDSLAAAMAAVALPAAPQVAPGVEGAAAPLLAQLTPQVPGHSTLSFLPQPRQSGAQDVRTLGPTPAAKPLQPAPAASAPAGSMVAPSVGDGSAAGDDGMGRAAS